MPNVISYNLFLLIYAIAEIVNTELKDINKNQINYLLDKLIHIYYSLDLLERSYDKTIISATPDKNNIHNLMFVFMRVRIFKYSYVAINSNFQRAFF